METMSEPEGKEEAPAPKKRFWLRKRSILIFLGVLLVLLHRPLLHFALETILIRVAAAQGMEMKVDVGGSVFQTLRLTDLELTGDDTAPLLSGKMDQAWVHYSPWRFLTGKKERSILDLQLVGVEIILNPDPVKTKPEVKKGADEIDPMRIPIPRSIDLKDITIKAGPGPDAAGIENLYLALNAGGQGELRFGKLTIPGLDPVVNVVAVTEGAGSQIALTGMHFGHGIVLERLLIDYGRLDYQELSLSGMVSLSQAPVSFAARLAIVKEGLHVVSQMGASGVRAGRLGIQELPEAWEAAHLRWLSLEMSGYPLNPSSLLLRMVVQADQLPVAEGIHGSVEAILTQNPGQDMGLRAQMRAGGTIVRTVGRIDYADDFKLESLSGRFRWFMSTQHLGAWSAVSGTDLAGDLEVVGSLAVSAWNYDVSAVLSSPGLRVAENELEHAKLATRVMGNFSKPFAMENLSEMRGFLDVSTGRLRTPDFQLQGLSLSAYLAQGSVHIPIFSTYSNDSALSARGMVEIPEDFEDWMNTSAELRWDLTVPDLGSLHAVSSGLGNDVPWQGAAYWSGDLRWEPGQQLFGNTQLIGSNLAMGGEPLREVQLNAEFEGKSVKVPQFLLWIDDENRIRASGNFSTEGAMPYELAVEGKFADLGKLVQVIPELDLEPMGGALVLNLASRGDWSRFESHAGELDLVLTDGQYGIETGLAASVKAVYRNGTLEAAPIQLKGLGYELDAEAKMAGELLSIEPLQLTRNGTTILSGSVHLPISGAEGQLPELLPTGPISANLRAVDLNIATLLAVTGAESDFTGSLSATFEASGSIEAPVLTLNANLAEFRTNAFAKGGPFQANMQAVASNGGLRVGGEIREPRLAPITFSATMPLPLDEIVQDSQRLQTLPLTAEMRLPSSDLAPLQALFPIVRQMSGRVAMNLTASGPVGDLTYGGSLELDMDRLRVNDPSIPIMTSVRGRAIMQGDRFTLQQLDGELAGGPFQIRGELQLPKGETPKLELVLKGERLLVYRNNEVTIRANSDLRVEGPINAAEVTGTIGMTNSRFFKEIEILPISMPGRPAPVPPQVRTSFGTTNPLFEKWKFDVEMRTDQPFVISSNLARGQANMKIDIGGTGRDPTLDGGIYLDRLVATLPFSRLDVYRGGLYFTPDDPLNPLVDLQGYATIRDYEISVYVFGRLDRPETFFVSQPPLPQEDIVALLASGSTVSELTSGGGQLAGRATMLLLQRLYRQIFPPDRTKDPFAQEDSIMDRFEFEAGGLDPRTGKQAATGRFRINNNLYLIGDVDVAGDFRGQIRYLIRFR